MVSKSIAWWMTRTQGIYVYKLSPFRQRALAGIGREAAQIVRQHWRGSAVFLSMCVGVYGLKCWAEATHHAHLRKDPAFFDREWAVLKAEEVAKAASADKAAHESDPDSTDATPEP